MAMTMQAKVRVIAGAMVGAAIVAVVYGSIRGGTPEETVSAPSNVESTAASQPAPESLPDAGAAGHAETGGERAASQPPAGPGEADGGARVYRSMETRKAMVADEDGEGAAQQGLPPLEGRPISEIEAVIRTEGNSDRKLEAIEVLADQALGLGGSSKPTDPTAVVSALRAAALDSDPEVGEAAVTVFEDIPGTSTISALGDVLGSKTHEDVKLRAIDVLSFLDEKGAAQALSRALEDESPQVREEAAMALGTTSDRDRGALNILLAAERREMDESVQETMTDVIESIQSEE